MSNAPNADNPAELSLTSDPNDPEGAVLARAIRFAPWHVAIATAVTLWWSFLVAGEFVLSGFPEWLGALAVLSIGGASYWALEQRFRAYMPTNTPTQRLMTVAVVVLLCILLLSFAMLLGLLLPEALLTPLMFLLVAGVALWQRRTRLRLYPSVVVGRGYAMAARLVLATVVTLFAIAALVTRQ